MQINGRENVIFSIFRDIEIAIYRGKKRGTESPRTGQRGRHKMPRQKTKKGISDKGKQGTECPHKMRA